MALQIEVRPDAAAVAWLLFLFIFAVTLVQWRLQKRWVSYD